ncbi:metallophosphoesterase [Anaerovibrio sp. JC8]|uniref:metallophosphoesterase n=1 Tax=Anaerovibrio sp. JC8 TaxID=1240085 RepID=UPI000A0E6397|nr:metallophosphoesterase [Anaerovibrio sp. JC8]ORT99445.1 metallophosphoesterase [Anaerovibrio sp. JC8]
MLFFFSILFIILTAIIIITQKALGLIFSGSTLKKARRMLLYGDILLVAGMVLGFTKLHGMAAGGIILQAATMVFMAQIVYDWLALGYVIVRFLKKKLFDVPENPQRRQFLKGAAVLPAVAVAVSAYGGLIERNQTVIRRYDVPVEHIPEDIRGLSIAQLSDIHLGPFMGLEELDNLLKQTSELGCDMLAITGDLFDDNKINYKAAKLVDSYVDSFKYGIYYCWGNHEHMRGLPAIDIAIEGARIKKLVNSFDKVAGSELPLYMAGVDYPIKRDQFSFLQDRYTELALEDIPEKSVKVLLAHHPDFIDSAAKYNTNLVLTGHTHGGQLGFFGIPLVPPIFKYLRGMYHVGHTMGYVHSGNGSWFPFRFGCPPEIAVFTLTEK